MSNVRIERDLPEEMHGFTIEFALGAYPRGSRGHRRAVYCFMRPATDTNRAKLKWRGRDAIVGEAPLDLDTGLSFRDLPDSVQERICLEALRPAARLAKYVNTN